MNKKKGTTSDGDYSSFEPSAPFGFYLQMDLILTARYVRREINLDQKNPTKFQNYHITYSLYQVVTQVFTPPLPSPSCSTFYEQPTPNVQS